MSPIKSLHLGSGGVRVDGGRGTHFPPWHQPWLWDWLEQTLVWGKPGIHQKAKAQVCCKSVLFEMEYSFHTDYLVPKLTIFALFSTYCHLWKWGLSCRNSRLAKNKSWWQWKDKCSNGLLLVKLPTSILIRSELQHFTSDLHFPPLSCNVFKHLLLYLQHV